MNKVKTYILIVFFITLYVNFSPCQTYAQALPSFTMQLTNGKTVAAKDMLTGKPLLLIYFSPDCEHCQKLITQILSKKNQFKKVNILLITFFPLKDAITFENNYRIKTYPNITVATETQPLYLRKYYSLQHTPFTALFNDKGKLIIFYKDETPVNELTRLIAKR